MAEDNPTGPLAAMRKRLEEKRKAAKEQLSTSQERAQNSGMTEAPNTPDLRDLLNKLRLSLRGDRLVPAEETVDEEST